MFCAFFLLLDLWVIGFFPSSLPFCCVCYVRGEGERGKVGGVHTCVCVIYIYIYISVTESRSFLVAETISENRDKGTATSVIRVLCLLSSISVRVAQSAAFLLYHSSSLSSSLVGIPIVPPPCLDMIAWT